MRTAILIGFIYLAENITTNKPQPKFASWTSAALIACMVMDVVEFVFMLRG